MLFIVSRLIPSLLIFDFLLYTLLHVRMHFLDREGSLPVEMVGFGVWSDYFFWVFIFYGCYSINSNSAFTANFPNLGRTGPVVDHVLPLTFLFLAAIAGFKAYGSIALI